jgi:hypothetical protein
MGRKSFAEVCGWAKELGVSIDLFDSQSGGESVPAVRRPEGGELLGQAATRRLFHRSVPKMRCRPPSSSTEKYWASRARWVAAIPNKKACGQARLTPGLPDLIVLTPLLGSMTDFIEFKTSRGRLSADQRNDRQPDVGALARPVQSPMGATNQSGFSSFGGRCA